MIEISIDVTELGLVGSTYSFSLLDYLVCYVGVIVYIAYYIGKRFD